MLLPGLPQLLLRLLQPPLQPRLVRLQLLQASSQLCSSTGRSCCFDSLLSRQSSLGLCQSPGLAGQLVPALSGRIHKHLDMSLLPLRDSRLARTAKLFRLSVHLCTRTHLAWSSCCSSSSLCRSAAAAAAAAAFPRSARRLAPFCDCCSCSCSALVAAACSTATCSQDTALHISGQQLLWQGGAGWGAQLASIVLCKRAAPCQLLQRGRPLPPPLVA